MSGYKLREDLCSPCSKRECMWLIVGLGNPTWRYKNTKHNVGFEVVEHLAKKIYKVNFKLHKKLKAQIATIETIILAKPQTYMNCSGDAVKLLINEYDIKLTALLVICDDVNLPLGKIRIRAQGSAGGHKGLSSIIESVGSTRFPRLRIGIGKPPQHINLSDYVLSKFTKPQRAIIDKVISQASCAVITIISENINTAMNKYNQ